MRFSISVDNLGWGDGFLFQIFDEKSEADTQKIRKLLGEDELF